MIIASFWRFPFLANEIFNCEINSLLDKFFDAPDPATLKKAKSESTPAPADEEVTVTTTGEDQETKKKDDTSSSDEDEAPKKEEDTATDDAVLVEVDSKVEESVE